MNIRFVVWIGMVFSMVACREEFDDHYHNLGSSTAGQSMTEALEARGEFQLFLQMIRQADWERTLNQSSLYTCLAPRDEHVQAWLNRNGWTVETMPEKTMKEFICYHLIDKPLYFYDFEKRYLYSQDWDRSPIQYAYGLMQDTRKLNDRLPAKKVRIFTKSYLNSRAEDYKLLRNTEPGDFMVENVPVSAEDRDLPVSNGVIHVLDGELSLPPRLDEVLERDPELSVLAGLFNRFKGSEMVGEVNGVLDTTRIKYYDVAIVKGNKVLDIASESLTTIAFLPTDDAMRAYFKDWLTEDKFGASFDSIPDNFVIPFLKALIAGPTSVTWGISDIQRNYPRLSSYGGDILSLKNNIAEMFKESVLCSNSVVYKLNKVPVMPLMSSVEAGFYIYHKRYKEWKKMIDKGKLSTVMFGTDGTYQHAPKIMLLQPDEATVWDNGTDHLHGVDGYEDRYLDTLAWRMSAGILDAELKDGQLEHRFYQSSWGALLCEQKDGHFVFSDFEGNEIRLMSDNPVWTAENGAIFEIDGIFEQLDSRDSTHFLYRKYIKNNPDLFNFRTLIEKAEMERFLDENRNYAYTVFAPSNDVYSLQEIETMTKEEAEEKVRKYIVEGRRIFTDGTFNGKIRTLGGGNMLLSVSGAWESFNLEYQYDKAMVEPGKEKSNLQGSNGVLHIINGKLEK